MTKGRPSKTGGGVGTNAHQIKGKSKYAGMNTDTLPNLPEGIFDNAQNYDEVTTDRWGNAIYTKDGKLHRLDGPAKIWSDGIKEYRQFGLLHREGGLPAVERADGGEEYRINNVLHRDGGLPALINADGHKEYRVHGELHRDGDLPAIECPDEYYYDCAKEEYYKHNKLHRDGDKPAKVWANGSKEYWKEGKLHRDGDLPAVIRVKVNPWDEGYKAYYKNHELHRDNGLPAVVYDDGREGYYENGKLVKTVYPEKTEAEKKLQADYNDVAWSLNSKYMSDDERITTELLEFAASGRQDYDEQARARSIQAIKHPKATESVLLAGLANRNTDVRLAAATNEKATEKVLLKAANDPDDKIASFALAYHPNASHKVWETAVNNPNHRAVFHIVAYNRDVPRDLLMKKAKESDDPGIVQSILKHKNITKQDAEWIAEKIKKTKRLRGKIYEGAIRDALKRHS